MLRRLALVLALGALLGVRTAHADEVTPPTDPTWEEISPESVNDARDSWPIVEGIEGPGALRAQILLDRALFSPGSIDGRWGHNAVVALRALQEREGLEPTGMVDRASLDRLEDLAGNPREVIEAHVLTEEEVAGPFARLPSDIQQQAKADCLCYRNLTEKLGEQFHVAPALLERLNPDVALDKLVAGDKVWVPAVRADDAAKDVTIGRIEISKTGHFVHVFDKEGRLVFHFPTTVGDRIAPTPDGTYKVTKVIYEPWWHFQPKILKKVDDDQPDALLPPGPNSAVGLVWMRLSLPTFGIHGTANPESIGHTTSNGCIRLTNWDALFLAAHVAEGTPVQVRR